MSISINDLFYAGYNPYSWYAGYDEPWIMRPAAAEKSEEAQKKQEEAAKKDDQENTGIIELRVTLCCEGTIAKIYKKLKAIEGVGTVDIDPRKKKVVVKGEAKPEAVLKQARKLWKRTELWKSEEK